MAESPTNNSERSRPGSGFWGLTGDAVLTNPVFVEQVGTFGVACGLALQGLKESVLSVNLKPTDVGSVLGRLRRRLTHKEPSDQAAWGVDIGQCALKAIRLEKAGGKVTATAFEYIEHPQILTQPDANSVQIIRNALATFLSRNGVDRETVGLGIAGQSALARFVKLPPVEEKKVADIVRFEAQSQIPFLITDVVWDFQQIGPSRVVDGFVLDAEVGLFAMKREVVERQLTPFAKTGVDVHILQLTSLALYNSVTWERRSPPTPRRCVVALDAGADISNLVIADGEQVIWQRPIPLGGNHFTRALAKEMTLTFADAEHLKRNATRSEQLAEILRAIMPAVADFVGEVQRSLGYFTNVHRDASIEYLLALGNTLKLPGLRKYLGEKLGIQVRQPQPFVP